jgi:glucose/arabinose dehydrogenase
MKILVTALVLFSMSAFAKKYDVETFVSQNDVIWGFDFQKDGTVLFTERGGKLFSYNQKTKKTTEITGVPKVFAVGQGGLLDLRVHPKNGYIYFTYSQPMGDKKSATTLARAKVLGNKLVEVKTLFKADYDSENEYHFGSRLEFDGKGHVFITSSERGERPMVQKLDNHLGKIIRINEDGSVPKDNPYVNDKSAKPEVYARGIRNSQGMAMRPGTDELWEVEMGPKGGDELNLVLPKMNFGWPVVTYGTEYEGPKIGEGTSKPGMEEPVAYWVPSISPSAMAFYSGDKMPEWKGNVFLALLSGQHLRRLVLEGKKVVKQEELLKNLDWRWRNVRTGPDGYLWFSTDEGKLGRIISK